MTEHRLQEQMPSIKNRSMKVNQFTYILFYSKVGMNINLPGC